VYSDKCLVLDRIYHSSNSVYSMEAFRPARLPGRPRHRALPGSLVYMRYIRSRSASYVCSSLRSYGAATSLFWVLYINKHLVLGRIYHLFFVYTMWRSASRAAWLQGRPRHRTLPGSVVCSSFRSYIACPGRVYQQRPCLRSYILVIQQYI